MKWKKISEEMPPLHIKILLGRFKHSFSLSEEVIVFEWSKCEVKRPFDKDKRYNEKYYEYFDCSESGEGWQQFYNFDEIYWTEINAPSIMQSPVA